MEIRVYACLHLGAALRWHYFFENRINLFETARNSVCLFPLRVSFSTQGSFKKFVQSNFDRTEIVTRNGF
jgi:hypothetical protein